MGAGSCIGYFLAHLDLLARQVAIQRYLWPDRRTPDVLDVLPIAVDPVSPFRELPARVASLESHHTVHPEIRELRVPRHRMSSDTKARSPSLSMTPDCAGDLAMQTGGLLDWEGVHDADRVRLSLCGGALRS